MTTSAYIIAKLIVQKSDTPISNLKLQKLLYYVQGWHLGIKEIPVFSEQIQAWIHGPVVPVIFQTYRGFKWNPITIEPEHLKVDKATSDHVLAVLGAYGEMTAAQLEALSHKDEPWLQARKGLGPKDPSNAVITIDSMKRYFGKLAHG